MKQLRAEGIQKLTEGLRADAVHLLRLSREDKEIQAHLKGALRHLEYAETRAIEIADNHRERTDA